MTRRIGLGLILLLALASTARGVQLALSSSIDFTQRWLPTRLILAGENPYQMLLAGRYSPRVPADLRSPEYLTGALPPSSLLVFLPLGYLPLRAGAIVWLIANMGAAAYLLHRSMALAGMLERRHVAVAVAALFIAGRPCRYTLGAGQLGIIAIALFLAALQLAERRRPVLAGLVLALSLVKSHVVGPFILLFFLLDRRWIPLLVCGAVHVVAHVGLCAWIGVSPVGVVADLYQLAITQSRYIDSLDPLTLSHHAGVMAVGGAAIAGLLICASVCWLRRGRRVPVMGRLSLACMVTLCMPTHRLHDYILLIFPLLWSLSGDGRKAHRRIVLVGVLYFFFAVLGLEHLGWRGASALVLYMTTASVFLMWRGR